MNERSCQPLIMDIYAGEPVSLETMLDDLGKVHVVYLGELHTIKHHHDFQLMVLRELFQRRQSLCLGMEMFSSSQQDVLDRWLTGHDTVSMLGEQLGKEKWTNLFDYQSLLLFAQDNGIRVIGLNAPSDIVRKVARGQMSDLTERERDFISEDMLIPNPLYDRLLRLKLSVHKAFQGKSLDGVVRAQLLRDSVMARTIGRFLKSLDKKDTIFVAVAGSGHLSYGFGIPERVRAEIQVSERIVLPTESGQLILSDEEQRQALPIEITHQDLRFISEPIADYLYVLPLVSAERKTSEGLRNAHSLE